MLLSAVLSAVCNRAPRYTALRLGLAGLLCLGAPPVVATAQSEAAGAAADAVRTALAHVMVTEPGALERWREPLSFGVPFPRGALTDAAELRCWIVKGGAALPVQARALSRWPDGSVRWALVDAQMGLDPRARVQLAIGLASDIPPTPSPWSFELGADATWVSDGTTRWPVFERAAPAARAGAPGSAPARAATPGDRVLGLAPRLIDRFGNVYAGVLELRGAEVLENGPLRVTLLLRGEHRSLDGAGLPIAFYTFAARISLLADCETARVQWTLENTPLEDPPGALAFRSYELLLDPGPGGRRAVLPVEGVPAGAGGDVGFLLRQNGIAANRCSALVNDREAPGLGPEDLWAGIVAGFAPDPAAPALDAPDTAPDASAPDAAPDTAPDAAPQDAGAALRGSFVHRVDSAHNHPAALMYAPGGPLRVGLLPESAGVDYWLDDATQKTFRLTLALTAGPDAEDYGRQLMLAARRPVLVTLDPGEVAASGAWGDAGLMIVPAAGAVRTPVHYPPNTPTGWTDWGEWHTRNTHATGSPRNRLSVFLEFVQTGRPDLLARSLARAWHAMDLRPFHIRGFRAADHPHANLWEGTPHGNEPPENRLGREGMELRFPEYKVGLPPIGHGYNGFDGEHMTLDDIYECWLLTGDWVAHDALVSAGEAMLTWRTIMPGGDLWSARNVGWALRALVQVYRATGEQRYLDAAAAQVATADKERGKGEVKYLRRGWLDPRHLANEPSESPWMMAIAIHGLCAYWAETRDPLVPPMLTDLVSFILSAYRGNGFADDLPTLRPASGKEPASMLGTSLWVPGALGAAAFVTGDHSAVDRIYPYYRLVFAEERYRPAAFGSSTWNWWQPYLCSLQSRYGEQALSNPGAFRMPSEPAR